MARVAVSTAVQAAHDVRLIVSVSGLDDGLPRLPPRIRLCGCGMALCAASSTDHR
ncbi:MAG TPA: hypothetical protein VEZ12_01030 [Herpetosiphonaceae bacterium]|nr:hypothetical protein [Herpetosiphonaceae bacterium]